MPDKMNKNCCDHGGKRSGCGRKPGVKTQPIRLPEWLLEQLSQQGDSRKLIIEACLSRYPAIKCPSSKHPSNEHSSLNHQLMNQEGLDTND
jgi:hypothetical protein